MTIHSTASTQATTIHKSDVERFLAAYAAAAAAFDSDATVALWGEPGLILTDDFCGALKSRAELGEGLEQGYLAYRRFGMHRVDFTVLDWTCLTGSIVRVLVRWHYFDAEERPLVDTDYEYVLRRDAAGLRAYVAISIDEKDRLEALAATR